jgi:hypothetical protein
MLRDFYQRLLDGNGWLLFILFCLVLWLFVFLNKEYVVTEELYNEYTTSKMQEKYDGYDELSSEFGDDIDDFEEEESNQWADVLFDFGFITLQSLFQFAFIATFLYVGLVLTQSTEELTFQSILKVVVVAEFIFFVPKLIKYSWFIFKGSGYRFEDVKNFNPLSLYGMFQPAGVADWLVYPSKFINVFEVLYMGLLVLGISIISKTSTKNVVFPVIGSYLFLMVLWISFRIYLSTVF